MQSKNEDLNKVEAAASEGHVQFNKCWTMTRQEYEAHLEEYFDQLSNPSHS